MPTPFLCNTALNLVLLMVLFWRFSNDYIGKWAIFRLSWGKWAFFRLSYFLNLQVTFKQFRQIYQLFLCVKKKWFKINLCKKMICVLARFFAILSLFLIILPKITVFSVFDVVSATSFIFNPFRFFSDNNHLKIKFRLLKLKLVANIFGEYENNRYFF